MYQRIMSRQGPVEIDKEGRWLPSRIEYLGLAAAADILCPVSLVDFASFLCRDSSVATRCELSSSSRSC